MTVYNYVHVTDVETEAGGGAQKLAEDHRASKRYLYVSIRVLEANVTFVLPRGSAYPSVSSNPLTPRPSVDGCPSSPAIWETGALGPRDFPQGPLAEYCQWAECQGSGLRLPSPALPPAPSSLT